MNFLTYFENRGEHLSTPCLDWLRPKVSVDEILEFVGCKILSSKLHFFGNPDSLGMKNEYQFLIITENE